MDLIADILLGGGALLTACYCLVLSRKLGKLRGLDQDLGGAIAVLSQQVDEMNQALVSARQSTETSTDALDTKTKAATETADRLELLLTALHDLPDPEAAADAEMQSIMATTDPDATVFVRSSRARSATQ